MTPGITALGSWVTFPRAGKDGAWQLQRGRAPLALQPGDHNSGVTLYGTVGSTVGGRAGSCPFLIKHWPGRAKNSTGPEHVQEMV